MLIFCLDLSSISLYIAKPQVRIRATSSYKLLKVYNKHLTSCSQACCKLVTSLLQAVLYKKISVCKVCLSLMNN